MKTGKTYQYTWPEVKIDDNQVIPSKVVRFKVDKIEKKFVEITFENGEKSILLKKSPFYKGSIEL